MLPNGSSNSAWGEPHALLDAPYTQRSSKRGGIGGAGDGCITVAHTTTSHSPSSMAAAARHTMPTDEAPPRSSRSAKFTENPQYSAIVAGWNCSDSVMSAAQQMPSTSWASIPASASAAATASAQAWSGRRGSPVGCRSAFHSEYPTMHASPRRPMAGEAIWARGTDPTVAPGQVMNSPALTYTVWPVIMRARSEQSHTAASATSSSAGISPSGMRSVISAMTSASEIPRVWLAYCT